METRVNLENTHAVSADSSYWFIAYARKKHADVDR